MNYLLAVIGSECQQRRENRIERLLVDHGHIRRLLIGGTESPCRRMPVLIRYATRPGGLRSARWALFWRERLHTHADEVVFAIVQTLTVELF
jgi:hypothetical protein